MNNTHAAGEQTTTECQAPQECNKLQEELHATQDRLLRCQADFDNFTRRTAKERITWGQQAQLSVITKFLPIVDDFDRAMANYSAQEAASWGQGIQMIHTRLHKVLQELQVIEIPYTKEFNPELMQAVMTVASADHAQGDVVAVLQKGYTMHGMVVRPAQVSVAA